MRNNKRSMGLVATWTVCLIALWMFTSCDRQKPTTIHRFNKPRTLTIAAASDMKFALDEFIRTFTAVHPTILVKAVYGSSGNFFAMVQTGAPFDLFLSADIEYPRNLVQLGHGAETNLFLYGTGRIVLWVPNNSPVKVRDRGMKALLEPSVRKIAMANPKHAPYGRAAEQAMKSLNVYDQVAAKLVFGENISQAMQFAQSGAADIGIVALSLALAPQLSDRGRYWEIPPEAYSKIEQGGLILRSCKDLDAAKAFRDLLLSKAGREILQRYGFVVGE